MASAIASANSLRFFCDMNPTLLTTYKGIMDHKPIFRTGFLFTNRTERTETTHEILQLLQSKRAPSKDLELGGLHIRLRHSILHLLHHESPQMSNMWSPHGHDKKGLRKTDNQTSTHKSDIPFLFSEPHVNRYDLDLLPILQGDRRHLAPGRSRRPRQPPGLTAPSA